MEDLNSIIREYENTIAFCKNHGLDEFEEKLRNKLDDIKSPLRIMIVGEGKSGKSTLLNALLGTDVAQVDDEPKTWCINLYTKTNGVPFAELVYPKETIKTTIKEAEEISERISKCKDISELSRKDRELREIRWHVKIEWPDRDIYVIDTPGFNQIRKDTSVETISIDGIEGVKFSAKESFDKYYYKADLVLWCFEATSVGDRMVEEHLKSVYKQGKRIYGIITKLDREEDPKTRERLFLENDNRYKKYNLVTSIRSGLPTIYDDDDEEEIEYKTRIRRESIESIRSCIDYLLNDNKETDKIKYENSKNYLDEIRDKIKLIEFDVLDFYYENMNIRDNVARRVEGELDRSITSPKESVRTMSDQVIANLKNPNTLGNLWVQSHEDMHFFTQAVAGLVEKSDFAHSMNNIYKGYVSNLRSLTNHAINSLKWKSVVISLDNPEDESLYNDYIDTNVGNFEFDADNHEIVIDIEQMGLAYQIMQLFDKSGMIYQAISLLAGDVIRENAINAAGNAILNLTQTETERLTSQLDNTLDAVKKQVIDLIDGSYERHTGVGIAHTKSKIVDLEDELSDISIYDDRNTGFVPEVHKGKIILRGSYYRNLVGKGKKTVDKKVVDVFRKEYLDRIFEKRASDFAERAKKSLAKYNGTKGVDMPEIEGAKYRFDTDPQLKESIPNFDKIDWKNISEDVRKTYDTRVSEYRIECKNLFKQEAAARERAFLEKRRDQIDDELLEEIEKFIAPWESQLKTDINWSLQNQQWTALPKTSDYFVYYSAVYATSGNLAMSGLDNYGGYPQNPSGLPASQIPKTRLPEYLYKYSENKKNVPEEYIKKFMLISAAGKEMRAEIRGVIGLVFDRLLEDIAKVKARVLKQWDLFFDQYISNYKKICDEYLVSMDQFFKRNLLNPWQEYKRSSDSDSKYRSKNILEYSIKAKKLPAVYTDFMVGNVKELNGYGRIMCSDGRTMQEHWKEYSKQGLGAYIQRWSEL